MDEEKMLLNELIPQFDDRGIQKMLREVEINVLACALLGASAKVQDRILKNMSVRAVEAILHDMETMKGSATKEEIIQMQEKIQSIFQTLIDHGKIIEKKK